MKKVEKPLKKFNCLLRKKDSLLKLDSENQFSKFVIQIKSIIPILKKIGKFEKSLIDFTVKLELSDELDEFSSEEKAFQSRDNQTLKRSEISFEALQEVELSSLCNALSLNEFFKDYSEAFCVLEARKNIIGLVELALRCGKYKYKICEKIVKKVLVVLIKNNQVELAKFLAKQSDNRLTAIKICFDYQKDELALKILMDTEWDKYLEGFELIPADRMAAQNFLEKRNIIDPTNDQLFNAFIYLLFADIKFSTIEGAESDFAQRLLLNHLLLDSGIDQQLILLNFEWLKKYQPKQLLKFVFACATKQVIYKEMFDKPFDWIEEDQADEVIKLITIICKQGSKEYLKFVEPALSWLKVKKPEKLLGLVKQSYNLTGKVAAFRKIFHDIYLFLNERPQDAEELENFLEKEAYARKSERGLK